MTTQLMPPIPPRAPAPLSENAGNTERAEYLARRTQYQARLRVYEDEVDRYKSQMRAFINDPDSTELVRASPQIIEHEPVPATPLVPSEQPVAQAKEIRFDFGGYTFIKPADLNELNLAVTLAGAAISMHVEAGDLFWHGGYEKFTWPDEDGHGVEMDAETLIEFARKAFSAS